MVPRSPTIVALGGGGFSMEPENPLLDVYVLAQAGVDHPRIAFLPTASGDAASYVKDFHAAFTALGARTEHVLLPWAAEEGGAPEDGVALCPEDAGKLAARLRGQDVIYVGGGNTRRMLAVWRAYGIDGVLRDLWQAGRVILAGLSAGSLCWYEAGVTDSLPGALTPMTCLGFLSGSHCPHYDGEAERRPSYEALVAEGALPAGVAAQDGCALRYRRADLVEIVSSRPGASAWHVESTAEGVTSRHLAARYLG